MASGCCGGAGGGEGRGAGGAGAEAEVPFINAFVKLREDGRRIAQSRGAREDPAAALQDVLRLMDRCPRPRSSLCPRRSAVPQAERGARLMCRSCPVTLGPNQTTALQARHDLSARPTRSE